MEIDFSKDFFQRSWGDSGYYEEFNYGVGFNAVVEKCLVPFYNRSHEALEIGCGGGTFTNKMIGNFKKVTAIDVIKMPDQFKKYDDVWTFKYVELPDKCYSTMQRFQSIDFAFSYNCFCHLSNEALQEYFKDIHYVMKTGGNFVFMLANFEYSKKQPECNGYNLGDMLPFGHFYQDERTLPLIISDGWEVVSSNLIPEHRDTIIHLKKK